MKRLRHYFFTSWRLGTCEYQPYLPHSQTSHCVHWHVRSWRKMVKHDGYTLEDKIRLQRMREGGW